MLTRALLEERPTLYFGFLGGTRFIEDLGDLKLWGTYSSSYIPWIIVETTVSDETIFHVDSLAFIFCQEWGLDFQELYVRKRGGTNLR